MSLPGIPVHDYRRGGMLAYVRDRADGAARLMDTVLKGLGPAGYLGRPFLGLADRLAGRKLAAMRDPYRDEILAISEMLGRRGVVAFSLSYEFGCTARVFAGDGGPVLFRTLDWPFEGLGELVEIVLLPGPAGDWITATWPGVTGCLHGAAPGRFAAALNQAPERGSRLGRAGAWIAAKRRFLAADGMSPPHLLRQVFEQAPDFAAARAMLAETPLAAPVIFTLCGPGPGEACTIERPRAGRGVHQRAGRARRRHHPRAGSGQSRPLAAWRGRALAPTRSRQPGPARGDPERNHAARAGCGRGPGPEPADTARVPRDTGRRNLRRRL